MEVCDGRLRYRIVDVIAERPLEGKPLGVVRVGPYWRARAESAGGRFAVALSPAPQQL